ncbi:hypothetical protein FRB96_004462 [Tulasnella sp. 330]|nr:hypothetical protein FRB96_004462 [Tulasnella sp. 330]KAG8880535.1 hypothetical protein FRB97_000705 [Tulasnella sp. 331]KAG8887203.1 hypothetical protein FRB98_000365 [Tulasnella sp. 332]
MSNRFVVGGRTNKREEAIHNLELARRQRLLPVQCWEKQWVAPQGALPGSTYKVLKWVKTDKVQEFSDDEVVGDTKEQLAPERDEIEALEGAADQEIEELEAADRGGAPDEVGNDSRAMSEDAPGGSSKLKVEAPNGSTAVSGAVTPLDATDMPSVPGISLLPPSPGQATVTLDPLPAVASGVNTPSPSPGPTPTSEAASSNVAMDVTASTIGQSWSAE